MHRSFTQAIFEQNPLYERVHLGKYRSATKCCTYPQQCFHHLPVGHLWADLLKEALARESLILQISHLQGQEAGGGSWCRRVRQEHSQLQVGKCNKNCFWLLSWSHMVKGKDLGSYFLQFTTFLHWSFLKSYSHFYCNQPRPDNQRYCLLFLTQTHLGSVYQNLAAGQPLYLLNLKEASLFHCLSPSFLLEDATDRRQAAK